MVQLIAGISIVIALGFIALYIKDFAINNNADLNVNGEEEAFCEIDMEYLVMNSKDKEVKNVGELKRKLQDFKNRNRFYK